MSWWGKVLGGAFGFAMGGPIGAILGAVIGHQLDTGLKKAAQYDAIGGPGASKERVQTAFFTTVFSVMGHLAKADGRVSETEIQMARTIMRQMQLDAQQQQFAIDFTKEKLGRPHQMRFGAYSLYSAVKPDTETVSVAKAESDYK